MAPAAEISQVPKLKDALLAKRQYDGATQRECWEELGVCKTTYISWEQGKSLPKPRNFRRISDYLGVSFDTLMEMLIA